MPNQPHPFDDDPHGPDLAMTIVGLNGNGEWLLATDDDEIQDPFVFAGEIIAAPGDGTTEHTNVIGLVIPAHVGDEEDVRLAQILIPSELAVTIANQMLDVQAWINARQPEDPPVGHPAGTGLRSPRQRWSTCCPHDPLCDHSFMADDELAHHLDTPITDAQAEELTR